VYSCWWSGAAELSVLHVDSLTNNLIWRGKSMGSKWFTGGVSAAPRGRIQFDNPGSARSLRFDVSWMERLRRQAHPSHPRSRSGQVPTPVYNDPATTARLAEALRRTLGAEHVVEMPAKMTSEDFSAYGRDGVKAVLLHSPRWLPKLHPTLDAMVDGEVAALRELFASHSASQ
jgi:hypothetical protein